VYSNNQKNGSHYGSKKPGKTSKYLVAVLMFKTLKRETKKTNLLLLFHCNITALVFVF